ncbi:hypothetical protein ACHAQJ_000820 [Trichoderma viride]
MASSLPPTERFEIFHQTSDDSNSALVILRYAYVPPAEQSKTVGHNKHTDIGIIPVPFTNQRSSNPAFTAWFSSTERPAIDIQPALRPDNRVSFIDSNGTRVTHWHDAKYEAFWATQEEQRRDTILTGGLEPVVASGVK